nr:frizzled 4 [Hymenolepis microstoma]
MCTVSVALLLLFLFSTSNALTNWTLLDSEYPLKSTHEIPASQCLPIEEPSCLGLEYTHTYLPNIIGLTSQSESAKRIHDYAPLLKLGCSTYLEFFLCSVYFPMCTESMGEQVLLKPCASFCNHVRYRCVPLMFSFNFPWPEELNCSRLPSDDEMCIRPHSFDSDSHLTEISTLVVNETVTKTSELLNTSASGEFTIEQKIIAKYILVGAISLNAICCLISVSLYTCNRDRFAHPLRPLVFLPQACMLEMSSYLPQLLFRRSVKDITADHRLINIACLGQFALAYYARTAIEIWFVILSLSWFLSACKSWAPEAIQGLERWFHVIAWVLPLFPPTFFLIFQNVDVDELTNSCYIGNTNKLTYFLFAILPEMCFILIGVALILLTLAYLLRMHSELKGFRPMVSNVTIKAMRTPANRRRLLKAVNRVIFTIIFVAGPLILGVICDLWQHIDITPGEIYIRVLRVVSFEMVGIGATLVLWFNRKSIQMLHPSRRSAKAANAVNFIRFQTLNPVIKGELIDEFSSNLPSISFTTNISEIIHPPPIEQFHEPKQAKSRLFLFFPHATSTPAANAETSKPSQRSET